MTLTQFFTLQVLKLAVWFSKAANRLATRVFVELPVEDE